MYAVWCWSLNRLILNFIWACIEDYTRNTEVYAGTEDFKGNTEVYASTEDFKGNTEVYAELYWSIHKEILNYIQSNNEFYTDWQVLQAETEMQIYI